MSVVGKRAVAAFAWAGALLAFALGLAVQPAYAADQALVAATGATGQSLAVSTQDYVYQAADAKYEKYVNTYGVTSGTVKYDPATKTLTLTNVKGEQYSSVDVNLEGEAVTVKLEGANSVDKIWLYTSSATVTGPGSYAGEVRADNFLNMAGGTVKGGLYSSKGSITMTGGTVNGHVTCYDGTFTMQGGKLTQLNDKNDAILRARSVVMKKGTISSKNCEYGITAHSATGKGGFKMSGGTVSVVGCTHYGLSVYGGNLVLTGGTLKATSCHGSAAISVNSAEYRSKNYGGKVQVKGGKLYATVTKPSERSAVYADSMSGKIACLKQIAGELPVGAHFLAGGNEYAVTKYNYVTLVKYNSTNKKPSLDKVTYGKYKYSIKGLGAGAFNTKNGHKISSLKVAAYPITIGKNALYGTSALKTLTFTGYWWKSNYNAKGSALKSVTVYPGNSIAKKAFAKCGKGGGKGLTVVFYKGVSKEYASKYRALLVSKGMSKSVKVKTI